MENYSLDLRLLLSNSGNPRQARQKIQDMTGEDIPYQTLMHWTSGRFDLTTIKRAFAIMRTYELTPEQLLEILENTQKT